MNKLLQDLSDWMWDPDEDQVEQFDRIAEMFYRETGFMRPGKSMPLEMGGVSEEKRQYAWETWRTQKCRDLLGRVRSALQDLERPDPERNEG